MSDVELYKEPRAYRLAQQDADGLAADIEVAFARWAELSEREA